MPRKKKAPTEENKDNTSIHNSFNGGSDVNSSGNSVIKSLFKGVDSQLLANDKENHVILKLQLPYYLIYR